MKYFQEAALILVLLTWLQFSAYSKDIDHESPQFRKVVDDFKDYLKHAISSDHENFEKNDAKEITNLEDSSEYFAEYSDKTDEDNEPEFETLMQSLDHGRSNSMHAQAYDEEVPNDKSFIENVGKKTPETSPAKQWQEEILYIKRSDPEQNEPISDVIEKILHESSAETKTRVLSARDSSRYQETNSETSSDEDNPEIQSPSHKNEKKFQFPQNNAETASDDNGSSGVHTRNHRYSDSLEPEVQEAEAEFDDVCMEENFVANTHQTCSGGPEYEIKFPPQFSEVLKEDMKKMVPSNYRKNEGDYNDNLGPGSSDRSQSDVEDRALCPYERIISSRNSSRVPEYLYEVHCSSTEPRHVSENVKGKFYCSEVKRLVPVLWLVGCSNGKRKYKQGWQQVAVSCAPKERREGIKQVIGKLH